MAHVLGSDIWLNRILLIVHEPALLDLLAVRATSRSGSLVVTADVILHRIDRALGRNGLVGLIDVERRRGTAGHPAMPKGISRFSYLLRCACLLGMGRREWRAMGKALRLARIYRLTPEQMPILVTAARVLTYLPTKASFIELPLAMAIYKKIIGHQLNYQGTNLALRRQTSGAFRIGDALRFKMVRVVDELPPEHPYRRCLNAEDPAVQEGVALYPSYSAFIVRNIFEHWNKAEGVTETRVLHAAIERGDNRYRRLLRDGVGEEDGIVAECCMGGALPGELPGQLTLLNCLQTSYRFIAISGFRDTDTIAVYLMMGMGGIELFTTEPPAAGKSAPFNARFPVTMPRVRCFLGKYDLDEAVISRAITTFVV
ncbi:unnamed protein product [Vitrella brassicaformis CCMP3155]|uniref:Uncharacterized protein n=2 Tax=Vitrella brassicaformis TaxID=1169539 RepID=A0A0G4F6S2_VITBC|nr:unnamed protein product [Vitrella brassicaformis CCMP3155]|mmetsp:Transcript_27092/g.67514  ORF Transcript_27092/g.67514 Transcript_27092/m.67514 type:complete len:371 (+) Transcript_27092:38-1150(+)|eukprot:CEM07823.1 unnamed protein product [Vitrella brassicaformis CCMP3155]